MTTASIAKALVPEHWQPTGSVIAAVIERQLAEGGLRRTGNHIADEHVTATAAGVDRIRALILSRPEDLAPSALPAAEAIQFCFWTRWTLRPPGTYWHDFRKG